MKSFRRDSPFSLIDKRTFLVVREAAFPVQKFTKLSGLSSKGFWHDFTDSNTELKSSLFFYDEHGPHSIFHLLCLCPKGCTGETRVSYEGYGSYAISFWPTKNSLTR